MASGKLATEDRLTFLTRRRPYNDGVAPTVIARNAVIYESTDALWKLFACQMIMDVYVMEQVIRNGNAEYRDLWLGWGFFEPPSYNWSRYESLCEQFVVPFGRWHKRNVNGAAGTSRVRKVKK